jgi:hypothetical protein
LAPYGTDIVAGVEIVRARLEADTAAAVEIVMAPFWAAFAARVVVAIVGNHDSAAVEADLPAIVVQQCAVGVVVAAIAASQLVGCRCHFVVDLA